MYKSKYANRFKWLILKKKLKRIIKKKLSITQLALLDLEDGRGGVNDKLKIIITNLYPSKDQLVQ
tara:strand:+ start:2488 stop:2682 length:195 start_codon:yes stop_codon:yes gene_type:complete